MSLPALTPTPLRDMAARRLFRVMAVVSILAWLASLGLLLVRVVPIIYGKTAVPLHYNIHVGVDTVGPWWRIFLVPAVGLIMMIANTFLARYMWSRDPELSQIIAITTLIAEVILLVATVFIVYLSLQYA